MTRRLTRYKHRCWYTHPNRPDQNSADTSNTGYSQLQGRSRRNSSHPLSRMTRWSSIRLQVEGREYCRHRLHTKVISAWVYFNIAGIPDLSLSRDSEYQRRYQNTILHVVMGWLSAACFSHKLSRRAILYTTTKIRYDVSTSFHRPSRSCHLIGSVK
jgi:hypothetical protein